jgi:hypothetical protein
VRVQLILGRQEACPAVVRKKEKPPDACAILQAVQRARLQGR